MPSKKIDFQAVKKLAGALTGVEDASTVRGFSLKVKGKILVCEPLNKSAEENSLMVRIGYDDREFLLATEPEIYYVPDHYRKHSCVLVRLAKTNQTKLKDLLEKSWQFVTGN